ncbi:MAG: DNA repair protein RecO [Candidatus Peribacteraceae bacterium]|nr:DNA repair protein RecO [Candidatus Peribacteraceae bacterium]MDD5075266.1 DNA repair protein RecO [Candidatus Peribacteraceae bacterium]
MPHSRTCEAIVLKSYDIGEADRFLILLTRECGRLAARAPGARRLKSRMGGSLLSLEHLSVEIKEHNEGWLVAGAHPLPPRRPPLPLTDFLLVTQAMELLLGLLHDEEPLPEIFDLTLELLRLPEHEPHHVLTFTLRLLSLMGVLPEAQDRYFAALPADERAFVERSLNGAWQKEVCPLPHVNRLCRQLIEEHSTRALHAEQVTAACG